MTDNICEMLSVTDAHFKNDHTGFRIPLLAIDAVDCCIGLGDCRRNIGNDAGFCLDDDFESGIKLTIEIIVPG